MLPEAPRVGGQKIFSGFIPELKFDLKWKDTPEEYGPLKLATIILLNCAGWGR